MRRALTRIAHEIIERNSSAPAPALDRDPSPRSDSGEPPARACSRSCSTRRSPLGDLDIGFYRDDLQRRPDAPVLHASHIDFDITGLTVVIVDDVLFTGRTVRAAIEALFDYGRPAAGAARGARRPRPPRASDPPRLRRQEPADLAREHVHVRVRSSTASTRWRSPPTRSTGGGAARMNHLLSIEELDRDAIERIVAQAERFAEVSDREIKKVPALRGRMVLNLFYEASTRTRSSFELAAKRLSADVVNFAASGSSVEKGESLKDTVLTLSAHKPDAIVLRTPWAGAAGARLALVRGGDRQRGRRQARAPNAGAARRLHAAAPLGRYRRRVDLDRRRRRALASGALEHPRLPAHGREGHGRRAADADPARASRRSAARCATRWTSSRAPTSSTRCACSASA